MTCQLQSYCAGWELGQMRTAPNAASKADTVDAVAAPPGLNTPVTVPNTAPSEVVAAALPPPHDLDIQYPNMLPEPLHGIRACYA